MCSGDTSTSGFGWWRPGSGIMGYRRADFACAVPLPAQAPSALRQGEAFYEKRGLVHAASEPLLCPMQCLLVLPAWVPPSLVSTPCLSNMYDPRYVLCNSCKSPDTLLDRDASTRIMFMRCQQVRACVCLGAKRRVPSERYGDRQTAAPGSFPATPTLPLPHPGAQFPARLLHTPIPNARSAGPPGRCLPSRRVSRPAPCPESPSSGAEHVQGAVGHAVVPPGVVQIHREKARVGEERWTEERS